MQPVALLALSLVVWPLAVSCGGSSGGSKEPPILPNEAPVMQVPAGLAGTAPRYTLTLPTAGTQTVQFAATDADGDILQWQMTVPAAAATAAGLSYQSPLVGGTFVLVLQAVTAPAAAACSLLVEDPRGAASAIDLLVVRSGPPTITAVSPSSAFAGQPQPIAVSGTAFRLGGAVNTTVRVAGQTATGIVVVDETRITCTTPVPVLAGATAISVAHAFGTSALPASSFRMFPYPPTFAANDQRVDTVSAEAPNLALDGTFAHAVWIETGMAMHSASVDGGSTWNISQSISGAELASEPQLLVAGTDLSIGWIGDGNAVWVRRSLDSGLSFLPAQRLDGPTTPATLASRPRLCQSGDRRHAAWVAGNASVGAARILAAASADRGATWAPASAVADGSANQGNHSIACDGELAWVVCEDERTGAPTRGVYVVRSANGGSTWEPALRLSQAGSAATEPQLCAKDGRVHVAWLRNGALYYNLSANNGITFGNSITELRGTMAGPLAAPQICCEGSRVVAIYIAAGNAVWVTRLDGTGALAQHTQVDTGTAAAAQPRIACLGNYVFAAWRKGDLGAGTARVQQTVSVDGGTTFLGAAGLGDGTASQNEPQLAHDGARFVLGWLDSRGPGIGLFVNRNAQ